jgi:hypothetical protein
MIGFLWVLFLLDMMGVNEVDIPLFIPCFMTIFPVGPIFIKYAIELSYFKKELNELKQS